jgi:hypothetical protein
MAGRRKSRRLMLDCEICGEPVYLSGPRYLELVKAGRLPRCRTNGCERLCGRGNTATARTPEILDVLDVPLRRVHWPTSKKGNRNGALAKLRVSEDQEWRWDAGGAVDR